MELKITRDLAKKHLTLGVALTVQERTALMAAELLSYDLYAGHTVADLEMGWHEYAASPGKMVDIEYAVRGKIDALNRILNGDAAAPAPVADAVTPKEPEALDSRVAQLETNMKAAFWVCWGLFALLIVNGFMIWYIHRIAVMR